MCIRDSIGIIADRQTASHDSRSAFGESAVQEQRTVGNMDAILLRREVRHPVSYTHLDVYKRQPQRWTMFT